MDRDFTFNQEAQDRAQSAGYKSQLSHPLLSPYLLTGTALTEETTPFTLVHRPHRFSFSPGCTSSFSLPVFTGGTV